MRDVRILHDDPIVILLTIANYDVKMILVDNESSVDILFNDCFQKMKVSFRQVQKINVSLVGFIGSSVQVEGAINMPVTARAEPHQSTVMLTFLVARVPSAYNAILGRP